MSEATEIAVRAKNVTQLFNSLDPSPFREKDLDADVESFVVEWVRELPAKTEFKVVICLPPEEATLAERQNFPATFSYYFNHRADATMFEWRELFRLGKRFLAIGTAVLLVCLIASQILYALIPNKVVARVVEESLIIVGWVANWKPIEIYLYDWVPLRRRIHLYRRIAAAPIEIRPI